MGTFYFKKGPGRDYLEQIQVGARTLKPRPQEI